MRDSPCNHASPVDLIIIGAPRSGTNILRDVLCALAGFDTWPCDEINYIWRHGNARFGSDALPADRATPGVVSYINGAFARLRYKTGCEVVVEKTCANSLRVPFVARALPNARYVFIHRDPIDAVASAMLRWQAPFELGYTLAKARFVPLSDVPYYGLRFVANRLHRLASQERRLAYWGPRLDGMDELLRQHSLVEICALQWRECVARSAAAFLTMPPEKVHLISYERLVASPTAVLSDICEFLGRSPCQRRLEAAVTKVTNRSLGKGRAALSESEQRCVDSFASPARNALRRLAATRSSDLEGGR